MKRRSKKIPTVLSDQRVEKLYSNLHNQTGFASLSAFIKSFKDPVDIIALNKSLSKIPAFSRHRRVRRNYTRPSMIIRGLRQYYCSDIADMSMFYPQNKVNYLLFTEDCFSKLLSVIALKRKTGAEVSLALKRAFTELKGAPENLLTDGGAEYYAKESKQLYKQLNVRHIISKTSNKSFFCESSIRLYKEKLFRLMTYYNTKKYVDKLSLVTKQFNEKVHSATGRRAVDITPKIEDEVFSYMCRKLIKTPRPKPIYSIGQLVRISSKRLVFDKAYLPGFSKFIFRIKEIKPTYPIYSYVLETLDNEQLESSFVAPELSPAN